jgi:hypothetical protein
MGYKENSLFRKKISAAEKTYPGIWIDAEIGHSDRSTT